MKLLPEKTVERLSKYRKVLLRELNSGTTYIYSHELAKLLHLTPVQVRRDIMLIGHSGTLRKGYDIEKLIALIGEIIDCEKNQNVAIIGIGNLGKALLKYFSEADTKLNMAAVFDKNEDKIGTTIHSVLCYDVNRIKEIFERDNITIAIITVPENAAKEVKETLLEANVKGIINYTPKSLKVENAFLEEYDMLTSLEKVAYFAKPYKESDNE
jgi:redox-sensing transcriptional repressor